MRGPGNFRFMLILKSIRKSHPGAPGPDPGNLFIEANKASGPGSPGAGSWRSPVISLLESIKKVHPGTPGSDPDDFLLVLLLRSIRKLLPGAPGPDPGSLALDGLIKAVVLLKERHSRHGTTPGRNHKKHFPGTYNNRPAQLFKRGRPLFQDVVSSRHRAG